MPYKQTTTGCVVRLVPLRGLSATTLSRCQALRAEVGRLWTDLVRRHADARAQHGQWLSSSHLTRTFSHSGHVRSSSPRGRRFRCAGCGAGCIAT